MRLGCALFAGCVAAFVGLACGSEGDDSARPSDPGGNAGTSPAAGSGGGGAAGASGTGGVSGGWPETGGYGGTGPCAPGETRACGSDVGECDFGAEACGQDGNWPGACTGGHPPSSEICDGLDQNCNGLRDDAATLPSKFDAMDWFDAGFFGLTEPGILAMWGSHGAVWEATSQTVITAFSVDSLWGPGSPGSPPPTSNIDATFIVPAGAYDVAADSLFVAVGNTLYGVDSMNMTWASESLETVFGLQTVEAMTVLRSGDIEGLNEPVLLAVSAGAAYIHVESAGLQGPSAIADLFCPPGSTGTCPDTVTSLSRADVGNGVELIVQDGTSTYLSPLIWEGSTWRFDWAVADTGGIPCQN